MSTPEKLVGGHATGTLTKDEKARLYTAALEDQTLFDRLMDEEALRELLADPAAKAQLLEALAQHRVVPFHRRPWVLGAAASLVLAVVTTWNVTRTAPSPAKATATTETAGTSPNADSSLAPRAPSQVVPVPSAPKVADEHRTAAPELRMKKAGVIALPQAAMAADKEEPAPPALATATAVETLPLREESKKVQNLAGMTQLTPGVTADRAERVAAATGFTVPIAKGKMEVVLKADPRWHLEPAEEGRTRLTVESFGRRHVYLLRRTADGVTVEPATGTGPSRSFLLRPGPATVWDLYVMPEPISDPKSLPATGPIQGWRKQILVPVR